MTTSGWIIHISKHHYSSATVVYVVTCSGCNDSPAIALNNLDQMDFIIKILFQCQPDNIYLQMLTKLTL